MKWHWTVPLTIFIDINLSPLKLCCITERYSMKCFERMIYSMSCLWGINLTSKIYSLLWYLWLTSLNTISEHEHTFLTFLTFSTNPCWIVASGGKLVFCSQCVSRGQVIEWSDIELSPWPYLLTLIYLPWNYAVSRKDTAWSA